MTTLQTRIAQTAQRVLRSPLLNPLNDAVAIDDLLGQLNDEWSLTQVRARILEVRRETADAVTLVLRPNARWKGHRPGQHVAVEVEIDGRRFTRTYTLSSIPGRDGTVEITVKQGGKVSDWLNRHAQAGGMLSLSQATGEFVLPEAPAERILLVSAGSGITPVMAMLRQLADRAWFGDVLFVHQCRGPGDLIFGMELQQMTARLPGLRLHLHYSRESGRLDSQLVKAIVPDYAARATYLCGPQGFMDDIRTCWEREKLDGLLNLESFTGPVARSAAEPGAAVEVRCVKSEQLFTTTGAQPLLMEAEAAGLKPKSGCRIGICQTCRCRKKSGTVQNLVTGKVSSEPGEMIQLCVSVAKSDVTLEI